MRISDWSSDVCSSDLLNAGSGTASPHRKPRAEAGKLGCGGRIDRRGARLGLLRRPATVGYARNFRRVDRQPDGARTLQALRSEEHTSELQSLMRSSYAVFCLKKKKQQPT